MTGILIYLAAPYLGWGLGAFLGGPSELTTAPENRVVGAVDWTDSLTRMDAPALAQFTLQLNYRSELDTDSDDWQQLRQAPRRMITVQTWSGGGRTYDNNPLRDVIEGRYDALLRQFLAKLPDAGAGTFLRLNPEMEVPVDQYPWQLYPSIYIGSYRHFADLCRELAPRARLVWGPAGYPGALEYYPGDDVVDAATVTYAYAGEHRLDDYPTDYTADYEVYRRLHRLRFLRVPVYVLGATDAAEQPDMESVTDLLRAGGPELYGRAPTLTEVTETIAGFPVVPTVFGLHDPNQRLLDDPNVGVEHIFLDLDQLENGEFETQFRGIMERGHAAIVTFEPYRPPVDSTDRELLGAIGAGELDAVLLQLYRILGEADHPVYLRYAHEMEIPIYRYPWQSQDPQVYIRSFRHVMLHDSLPKGVQRIWGPAGDRGSLEWYPGDDAVDLISIAIYGLPDKNITDPEQQEQFATIFQRKVYRMRFVGKPIFITEFGVKGPEAYQTDWMLGAAETLQDDPRIVGINYFNMSDLPQAWGEIKPPDWSISRATLDTFVRALQ